jgi:hypothetical protein
MKNRLTLGLAFTGGFALCAALAVALEARPKSPEPSPAAGVPPPRDVMPRHR